MVRFAFVAAVLRRIAFVSALFVASLHIPAANADELVPGKSLAAAQPFQLPPVVISATLLPTPADQIGSSVTVITAPEIEQKQQRTLGAVAVASTMAAQAALGRRGVIQTALAGFAAAFVVYEGALYLVSATVMGGTEDFTAAIVVRIRAINAAGFVAHLAASMLLAAAGAHVRMSGMDRRRPARI